MRIRTLLMLGLAFLSGCAGAPLRGTGDLGVVVEREAGRVLVVDTTGRKTIGTVAGLGDLSHASIVYGRDGRYAYVFGRDGGLSKVDLLRCRIEKRVVQAGNSIGGAISQDGRLVAAQNYVPGGVKVFDAATLELVADIPAAYGDGKLSRVVGLADAPGNRFVFSLYDAGEIWVADLNIPAAPRIQKFANAGKQPYDGLITPDGRYYLAGLFGEDGLALLDLWHPERGVRHILDGYGHGEEKLPVYKMPHLRGWSIAGDLAYLPAIGRHELLVVETQGWREVVRIPVAGQPVFAIARPGGRQVWVNFAFPDNGMVQVVDTEARQAVHTLYPGKAVLHMEFTPRGEAVWVSSRDDGKVVVYDTDTLSRSRSFQRPLPAEFSLLTGLQRQDSDMDGYSELETQLLNNFQHSFPLVHRPFHNIGRRLGLNEKEVIDGFSRLADAGAISRIGPVFNPGSIGVSTLAALSVSEACVEEVALWLNTFPEINHNYAREHAYNLWFVVTAPDQDWLDRVLHGIARDFDGSMLVLPMVERYHIDLGFDLSGKARHGGGAGGQGRHMPLNRHQTKIVAALQSGIQIEPEPFASVCAGTGLDEDEVIDQIVLWRMRGVIKRFGVVVQHRELGYRDNAMVVWDVPDHLVNEIGRAAAQQEGVTLCYRRQRQLPSWPYNLFCMVHGTDRAVVEAQIARLAGNAGLSAFPSQILFSRQRFKQCGARYVHEPAGHAACMDLLAAETGYQHGQS